MSNIVELKDHRRGEFLKLVDAHRAALVELVCAFATHSDSGNDLERLDAAQDEFVRAYTALNASTAQRIEP